MTGRIDFRYDAANDVIIATPHWKIESEADVIAWYEQYCAFMKKFGRKVDTVVVSDGLTVSPTVGAKWGEYRAKIHKQFVGYNYRVHCNSQVRLFVNTSGVRYDIGREEAATVEDAIEGIQEQRRRAKSG